jgi:hypothetical protein
MKKVARQNAHHAKKFKQYWAYRDKPPKITGT